MKFINSIIRKYGLRIASWQLKALISDKYELDKFARWAAEHTDLPGIDELKEIEFYQSNLKVLSALVQYLLDRKKTP